MTRGFGILLFSVLAFSAGPAAAAEPWEGSWRYAGGSAEDGLRKKAISEATEDLSFVVRGTARSRLQERLKPAPRLSLESDGTRVTIRGIGGELTLTLGAAPVKKTGPDGDGLLSVRTDGDALVLVAKGEKGTRTSVFKRRGDSLVLNVTLDASLLSKPVKTRATFSPAG